MINKHANQISINFIYINGFFLLVNVNDYQPSSRQVVSDHSAIIMGLVLSVYLCIFFVKQQLVNDERKFIKHFEQQCRDMYKEIKQVCKPEAYLTVNINKKSLYRIY